MDIYWYNNYDGTVQCIPIGWASKQTELTSRHSKNYEYPSTFRSRQLRALNCFDMSPNAF